MQVHSTKHKVCVTGQTEHILRSVLKIKAWVEVARRLESGEVLFCDDRFSIIEQGSDIVSEYARTQQQMVVQEAEGYLDLIMVFADRWPVTPALRDRLAERTLEILEKVEYIDIELSHVNYLRGEALRCLEKHREALVPLQKAAQQDPANIRTWLALGWCYKRLNRIDLAVEALEESLMVDSSGAIIHYNLACYWSLACNTEQALHHLAVAFDIDPNYRDLVANETDFDSLRSNQDFRMLTGVVV